MQSSRRRPVHLTRILQSDGNPAEPQKGRDERTLRRSFVARARGNTKDTWDRGTAVHTRGRAPTELT